MFPAKPLRPIPRPLGQTTGVYHRPSIARCVATCAGSLAAGPAALGPWAEESPEYQGEPPYQDRCEPEALPEVKVLAMNRYLCWALLAFFGLIQLATVLGVARRLAG
jgi:hypothetical protein